MFAWRRLLQLEFPSHSLTHSLTQTFTPRPILGWNIINYLNYFMFILQYVCSSWALSLRGHIGLSEGLKVGNPTDAYYNVYYVAYYLALANYLNSFNGERSRRIAHARISFDIGSPQYDRLSAPSYHTRPSLVDLSIVTLALIA